MSDNYYYIDYDTQEIQNNKFICVYVLNFERRLVFKIYKQYNDKLAEYLNDLGLFEEISSHISFNIKRDGKIALDIKI